MKKRERERQRQRRRDGDLWERAGEKVVKQR